MSATSNTPRILTRGDTVQFKVGFFADPAQTTPLVPLSPDYPAYTIYDPSGTSIQSGVGTQGTPGNFSAGFLVPKDAPLSWFQQAPQRYGNEGQGAPLTNPTNRYRVEWTIVTAENYQVQFVEEFDVRDVAVTQSLSRELKYLTLSGDAVRLLWRTSIIPYRIDMKFFIRGADATPNAAGFYDGTPASTIQMAQDGDSYVFYYDVAAGVTQGNTAYMALWKVQETQFSVPTSDFQIVTAISTGVLPLITTLRMLIDKFQKRLGRLQAYEDSDLLEYIAQGVHLVNLSHPATSYSLNQMPEDFLTFVILAAAWYGLGAQSILETDLSFNFSGQSVTLSVDRAAALDSVAAKMRDWFNDSITPAKTAWVRRARGVGTVAGRAYNYRQMYQYVYRIGSMGSDTLLTTLTKIGLL